MRPLRKVPERQLPVLLTGLLNILSQYILQEEQPRGPSPPGLPIAISFQFLLMLFISTQTCKTARQKKIYWRDSF